MLLIAILSASVFMGCAGTGDDDDDDSSSGPDQTLSCLPDDIYYPAQIEVEREATGKIETMDMEDYLKGVIIAEMGPGFPDEALQAQAIAARSYAIRWISNYGDAICDSTSCQVYVDDRDPVTDAAVEATRGVVAVYDSEIIEAVFFASSGGYTSGNEEVWGGDPIPYLAPVSDLENELCTDQCDDWPVESQTPCVCNGSYPCTDAFGNVCCWGRNGHGVGLSQRGAQAMAECGYDSTEIIRHFYTGVELFRACD